MLYLLGEPYKPMPTVVCPVEGFEHVSITFPDTWLYVHYERYQIGLSEAPENATDMTKRIYGAIALCDAIEGIDLSEGLLNQPLSYIGLFNWIKDTVLFPYLQAYLPKKNGLSVQPSTEKPQPSETV